MRPTISYLRVTCARYNDLAFGGSLPEPLFFLVTSKTFGRTCGWERRMPDGSSVRGDYSGINVPLVAVCNVPPVAQCNVPPQKWLQ